MHCSKEYKIDVQSDSSELKTNTDISVYSIHYVPQLPGLSFFSFIILFNLIALKNIFRGC